MISIDKNPSALQLKVFSVAWLVFCAAVGLWLRRYHVAMPCVFVLWGVGGAGAALGLVLPRSMRSVYLALASAAHPFGAIASVVLLGLIFFAVLTPIALWLRIRGKDPLEKSIDRAKKSYWRVRSPSNLGRYFKLY